ncbi:sialate O-acetylesterase [Prosthecobacter sp.]|uniref:sialate O-acetylesterase n=1 Tax=Prosthecobacter sp. TaxID=1965333 RepID=UPI003783DA8E
MKWALLILMCACAAGQGRAAVRMPAVFSDHAVLQQGVTVPVWGWADKGEKVTVALGGQTQTATAGGDGKWRVDLKPLSRTEKEQALEMTITGTNMIRIQDVLVGETWLCAGQSNMVMTVAESKDYEKEKAAATLPQIRMFTVKSGRAEQAQEDCEGAWVVCGPETVGEFSAVGFYFARKIQQRLGGAVGVINSSAGGTLIESWLDREVQEKYGELKPYFVQRERLMAEFDREKAAKAHEAALIKWKAAVDAAHGTGKAEPKRPSDPYASFLGVMNVGGLHNGKIAPLAPYAVRGMLWYQGESNATAERAPFYETQMRLLVKDWRACWGAELPFAWVQLPNLNKKAAWPEIREAQRRCLDLPKTGMAITLDVGESKDVHPKNKQVVGHRLALWALGKVYGQDVPATSGPLLVKQEIRGGEIALCFEHANGGLVAQGGGALKGFVIAGENRAWKPAVARIEGDVVIVSAPQVRSPVAVRYAWAADPEFNLFNGEGLPASPFRTDLW